MNPVSDKLITIVSRCEKDWYNQKYHIIKYYHIIIIKSENKFAASIFEKGL